MTRVKWYVPVSEYLRKLCMKMYKPMEGDKKRNGNAMRTISKFNENKFRVKKKDILTVYKEKKFLLKVYLGTSKKRSRKRFTR